MRLSANKAKSLKQSNNAANSRRIIQPALIICPRGTDADVYIHSAWKKTNYSVFFGTGSSTWLCSITTMPMKEKMLVSLADG